MLNSVQPVPPALVALATSTSAQVHFDNLPNSAGASVPVGVTLTFHADDETNNCGQGPSPYDTSSTVTFYTKAIPDVAPCLDLEDLWTHPNVIYSTRGFTCADGDDCGLYYSLGGVDNWNASANYSMVYYTQNGGKLGTEDEDPTHWGPWYVSAFAGKNCLQSGPDSGRGEGRVVVPMAPLELPKCWRV